MNKYISKEDALFLQYFWEEKEDVTRWADWKRFKEEYPMQALYIEGYVQAVEQAKQQVTLAIRRMTETEGEDK